ncbi:hypothetical protein L484_018468 [Morus notabilis]|uniref:Protein PHLOEM PROTEIN 2-LIKE A1 n=1 Tax=Morus notabilis TaxID=981085 RepID=W9SSF6_9ROSA|nr:hypothetical protein L484_018468 [Morus notabilis]
MSAASASSSSSLLLYGNSRRNREEEKAFLRGQVFAEMPMARFFGGASPTTPFWFTPRSFAPFYWNWSRKRRLASSRLSECRAVDQPLAAVRSHLAVNATSPLLRPCRSLPALVFVEILRKVFVYCLSVICAKIAGLTVDEMAKTCYMLYAKDLSIIWGDDSRYWRWLLPEGTSCHTNKMAELINVCWLEVHGNFDTTKLSHETLYEVSFVVKLKSNASGWNNPMNVELTLPDGSKHVNKVDMSKKPREQWLEIPAGKFRTFPGNYGELKFHMGEHDDRYWESGLIVMGVQILPKMI